MPPLPLAVMVLTIVAVYLGLTLRRRRWCPRCGKKGLKQTNWFRCNPPPNRSYFACGSCRAEFVQVDRYDGVEIPMTPRVGSPWELCSGWEASGRVGSPPQE